MKDITGDKHLNIMCETLSKKLQYYTISIKQNVRQWPEIFGVAFKVLLFIQRSEYLTDMN